MWESSFTSERSAKRMDRSLVFVCALGVYCHYILTGDEAGGFELYLANPFLSECKAPCTQQDNKTGTITLRCK